MSPFRLSKSVPAGKTIRDGDTAAAVPGSSAAIHNDTAHTGTGTGLLLVVVLPRGPFHFLDLLSLLLMAELKGFHIRAQWVNRIYAVWFIRNSL